ncbi:hypothetical protein BJ170DRAFT_731987 [Xylariales sp. AK1849]|nr:hypothetical protein BJ170DRAFT_731987 [Xylariales sp. AK1849]
MPRRKAEFPALAPDPKRNKAAPKVSMFTEEPVKFQIGQGDTTRTWFLHRQTLCRYSEVIARELATKNVIVLEHVRGETLESFAIWLYGGGVVVDGLETSEDSKVKSEQDLELESEQDVGLKSGDTMMANNSRATGEGTSAFSPITIKDEDGPREKAAASTADPTAAKNTQDDAWYLQIDRGSSNWTDQDCTMARLLDLYLFGTRYKFNDLTLDVLLTYQRYSRSQRKDTNQHIVKQALKTLSLDDRLCRYWIADYAHNVPRFKDRHYNELPSEFLVKAYVKVLRGFWGKDNGGNPDADWCEFHDHETIEEREECKRGREGDPDIQGSTE